MAIQLNLVAHGHGELGHFTLRVLCIELCDFFSDLCNKLFPQTLFRVKKLQPNIVDFTDGDGADHECFVVKVLLGLAFARVYYVILSLVNLVKNGQALALARGVDHGCDARGLCTCQRLGKLLVVLCKFFLEVFDLDRVGEFISSVSASIRSSGIVA